MKVVSRDGMMKPYTSTYPKLGICMSFYFDYTHKIQILECK